MFSSIYFFLYLPLNSSYFKFSTSHFFITFRQLHSLPSPHSSFKSCYHFLSQLNLSFLFCIIFTYLLARFSSSSSFFHHYAVLSFMMLIHPLVIIQNLIHVNLDQSWFPHPVVLGFLNGCFVLRSLIRIKSSELKLQQEYLSSFRRFLRK